jgi:type II secretory pathway pseudopilin PulG
VRQLTAQDGFSLVEALLGAAVSVLVAGAVAVGLVQNNDSALATQRQSQLVAVLQARIEWVHQLLSENYTSTGFGAIALSQNPKQGKDPTLPTLPRDPSDPNDFITNYSSGWQVKPEEKNDYEGFLIEKNYGNTEQGYVSGATSKGEQLVVDSTNGKIPPENFVDITTGETSTSETEVVAKGHPYAVVNTYVTLASEDVSKVEGGCPTTAGTGSTAADARRIVVAARYHAPNGVSADSMPQYATTLLTNPTPSNQCQNAQGWHF